MTQEHLITPPDELVQQWMHEASGQPPGPDARVIAIQAANWGWHQRDASVFNELQEARDEELEACVGWLISNQNPWWGAALQEGRRPKPPSLKELNLKHLEVMERDGHYLPEIISDLRRAIESLPC
jgi:hypothetical protein